MRRTPLLLLILCALPATASAQQHTCTARGLDAFDTARRARRVIQDYATLNGVLQRDISSLDDARTAFGAAPLPRRLYAAPIVERTRWYDLPTCYDGKQRNASLRGLRYGVIAGADLRDLNLRFEGFVIQSEDSLDITLPAAAGGEPTERTLAQGQSMFGARAQVTRWASLTLGLISDDRSPDPADPAAASSRVYLALGVPALNLRTDLILDRRDQSLQTLYLDLDRLPLTRDGLTVSARAGYLEDEAQVFTTLGASIPLAVRHDLGEEPEAQRPSYALPAILNISANLIPEVSVEWDDPRLRHARLRGDVQYAMVQDLRVGSLYAVEEEPFPDPIGALYMDLGVFWEATTFHSRALEQRVGETWAWGWGGGGRMIFGFNVISLIFDTSFHLNRPETIAQVSELVGAGEWRLLASLRVGSW
jgi:hypothetical protein